MKKNIFRRGIILIIIGLFIVPVFIPNISLGDQNFKNLILEFDDFFSIQDAIDSSSEGDTILVPSGTYYENIIINKTISLIGQDSIIDGKGQGIVVNISSDLVNVSGFVIKNGGNRPEYDSGIHISSNNTNISNNVITSNQECGVFISSGFYDNNIKNNTISYNKYGIFIFGASIGFNYIYHNNFIDNMNHAYDRGNSKFDNGYPSGGNYWDDYSGNDNNKGPNQDITGPDGIGDNPYFIEPLYRNNMDNYPYMYQDGWIPPIPRSNLDCKGSFNQINTNPNETIPWFFSVRNIGDPGSFLDWKIESYPNWGIWEFTPEMGYDLSPDDGYITIGVTLQVPNINEGSFEGEIKIINIRRQNDYCTIPVYLTTPKTKLIQNFPFIKILENHPHLFPILQRMLKQIV